MPDPDWPMEADSPAPVTEAPAAPHCPTCGSDDVRTVAAGNVYRHLCCQLCRHAWIVEARP